MYLPQVFRPFMVMTASPVPQVIHWIWKHYLPSLQLTTVIFLEHSVDLVVLGIASLAVLVLRMRGQISIETATLVLIGTIFAISSHIFPWYTTALSPWIAILVGPLWADKRLNGKGLAAIVAWYFTFTVLYGYYLRDSFVWTSYYTLVYDVVLLGLVVAALAEGRRVKAS